METYIDDAKNHFLNDFPDDVHIDQAYLHIGIFLGWIIENGLYSKRFEDEFEVQIYKFKRHEDVSCVILGELWDGLVYESQFSTPEGREFVNHYYKSGMYMADFKETLAKDLPSVYYVKDTWENYRAMYKVIGERFSSWKDGLAEAGERSGENIPA